ncbi:DNA polymerase II [Vibrio sp. JCM 19236]|nr:DNA polymerase II [Vibrio sp. JCM 19236]
MTLQGPEPLDYVKAPMDYQHYIDKQIKPVADAILPFVGSSLMKSMPLSLDCFN